MDNMSMFRLMPSCVFQHIFSTCAFNVSYSNCLLLKILGDYFQPNSTVIPDNISILHVGTNEIFVKYLEYVSGKFQFTWGSTSPRAAVLNPSITIITKKPRKQRTFSMNQQISAVLKEGVTV